MRRGQRWLARREQAAGKKYSTSHRTSLPTFQPETVMRAYAILGFWNTEVWHARKKGLIYPQADADLRFTRSGANVALYEGSIGGSSPILDLLSYRN